MSVGLPETEGPEHGQLEDLVNENTISKLVQNHEPPVLNTPDLVEVNQLTAVQFQLINDEFKLLLFVSE